MPSASEVLALEKITLKLWVQRQAGNFCFVYLNRIDIIGDDDQLCLLLLNKSSYGVGTMPYNGLFLSGSVLLASSTSLCPLFQAFFLLLLALGTIIVHESKQISSCDEKKARQHLLKQKTLELSVMVFKKDC